MSIKPTRLIFPLSFMLLFLVAEPSHAATPTTVFGVSATVTAGCSVSPTTPHASYGAEVANAASLVTVTCSNTAQYVITVSSLAPANANTVVPVGNLSFPLASLMKYAVPSDSPRSIMPSVTASANNKATQPLLPFDGAADKSAGASILDTDAISVAITY